MKNINLYKLISLLVILSALSGISYTQPYPVATFSASVNSHQTYPSNGSFQINPSVASTLFRYQLISGPGSSNSSPQASNLFQTLLAGTYSVAITCAGTPNQGLDTADVVINNNYTALSSIVAATTSCASNSNNGQITVTVLGSGPFTYAFCSRFTVLMKLGK